MPRLEEKVNKILDYKLALAEGKKAKIKMSPTLIEFIENHVKESIIEAVSNGTLVISSIANRLGIESSTLEKYVKLYEDQIPEEYTSRLKAPIKPKEVRVAQINQAIADGASSASEISEVTGLKISTIMGYHYKRIIDLPWVARKENRRSKKDTVARIEEMVNEGATSREEIAEKLGLSTGYTCDLARRNGIELPKGKNNWGNKQKNIEKIREIVEEGKLQTTIEIAAKMNLAIGTVQCYASQGRITLPDKRPYKRKKENEKSDQKTTGSGRSKRESIETIINAINDGADDVQQIAKRAGLAPNTVISYCYEKGIIPPGKKKYRKKSESIAEIKEAIDDGATSLKEISKISGLTENTIRAYASHEGIDLPMVRAYGPRGRRESCKPFAEHIRNIEKAIADGVESVQDIAKQVGLSEHTVRNYAGIRKIGLPRVRKYKELNVPKVIQAIEDGAKDVRTICEVTGLSDGTIRNYNNSRLVEVPSLRRYKKPGDEERKTIQKVLDSGVTTLEDLCKSTDKSPPRVGQICRQHNIDISYLAPWRNRPEIDKLIDQGKTLEQIGLAVNLSREMIRLYIRDSGQYNYYRKNREKVINAPKIALQKLNEGRKNILLVLEQIISNKAKEEGWAMEKSIEYFSKRGNTKLEVEQIYAIFGAYQQAKERNIKLSVAELGEISGTSFTNVSRILATVGEDPMHGKFTRKATPKWKKKAIRKVFDSEFNAGDIAYLLDLPHYVVSNIFERMGKRPHAKKSIKCSSWKYHLTNRTASLIYEAKDAGFTEDKMVEYAGTNEKLMQYALDNRDTGEEIGKEIVKVINILYPKRGITTPYVIRKISKKRAVEYFKEGKTAADLHRMYPEMPKMQLAGWMSWWSKGYYRKLEQKEANIYFEQGVSPQNLSELYLGMPAEKLSQWHKSWLKENKGKNDNVQMEMR